MERERERQEREMEREGERERNREREGEERERERETMMDGWREKKERRSRRENERCFIWQIKFNLAFSETHAVGTVNSLRSCPSYSVSFIYISIHNIQYPLSK